MRTSIIPLFVGATASVTATTSSSSHTLSMFSSEASHVRFDPAVDSPSSHSPLSLDSAGEIVGSLVGKAPSSSSPPVPFSVDIFEPPGSSILVALEGAGADLSLQPGEGSWHNSRTYDFTNEASIQDLVDELVGDSAQYARPATMDDVESFIQGLGLDFVVEPIGGDVVLSKAQLPGCEESTKKLKIELMDLVG